MVGIAARKQCACGKGRFPPAARSPAGAGGWGVKPLDWATGALLRCPVWSHFDVESYSQCTNDRESTVLEPFPLYPAWWLKPRLWAPGQHSLRRGGGGIAFPFT